MHWRSTWGCHHDVRIQKVDCRLWCRPAFKAIIFTKLTLNWAVHIESVDTRPACMHGSLRRNMHLYHDDRPRHWIDWAELYNYNTVIMTELANLFISGSLPWATMNHWFSLYYRDLALQFNQAKYDRLKHMMLITDDTGLSGPGSVSWSRQVSSVNQVPARNLYLDGILVKPLTFSLISSMKRSVSVLLVLIGNISRVIEN